MLLGDSNFGASCEAKEEGGGLSESVSKEGGGNGGAEDTGG